jgi:hypothetical protein
MDPMSAIKSLTGGVTASQQKMLDAIQDPEQKAMQQLQLEEQNKELVATTISNILKMRHDALMTVANNLKA